MPVPADPRLRRDWTLFGLLTFCFACGFAVYGGIFQNFIREDLGVGPERLGVLESLREIPGLLTAFLAASLVALAETRLAGLAMVCCAVGVGLTGYATNFALLVALTMFWSIGGHIWFSLSPAIVMTLARGEEGGRHLGRMAGIGSCGTLLALAATTGFLHWFRLARPAAAVPYRGLFVLSGALILAGAALSWGLSAHGSTQGARVSLVYRPRYRLYYVLTFLEGCRRQIFSTFAPFVLILVFKVPVQTMLVLAFVNAALTTVVGPAAGRWIDRRGERATLTVYYALLVFVFAGYAAFQSVPLLFALYLLDSLLFTLGMGITVFLNRLVEPGELTPSLAMGTTMNHVAAVVVPVTGGVLWKALSNYRIPFWIGIVVVVLSLWATQSIPDRVEEPPCPV